MPRGRGSPTRSPSHGALELLRAAIGVPEIPVVIEDIASWRATADVADRYQDGRVFLAGDAAHVVPPNGGFGGSTGVQDAHNLAWKLALVLAGRAGPELLATYDAERRPIGELTIEQAYSRYVMRVAPYLGSEDAQPLVDDLSMEIGHRSQSAAVVLEPGARRGARPALGAYRLGLPLDLRIVGQAELADPDGRFAEAYGVCAAGAVIVRPDGIVAWRAVDATGVSPEAMDAVLASLVCRPEPVLRPAPQVLAG